MTSPLVAALRSVALNVPDPDLAVRFYTEVWRLTVADRQDGVVYLRGTGPAHHLLALHPAERAEVRNVTFQARSADALQALAERTVQEGGRVLQPVAPVAEPGGGAALTIADQDGRIFRFVHGDSAHAVDAAVPPDRPVRLAHVVLNSHDVSRPQGFFERALGFTLSDRTRMMAFLRCDSDHHCIAFGDSDRDSLNHIAFLMPDLDSVMRGGGRMKDAGYPVGWGPGRHGPGNNAFNYFVGPFDMVIEYTAEVQQVDDSYPTGGPEDWTWPPGRIDQWGIGQPPTPAIKAAQQAIRFMPVAAP